MPIREYICPTCGIVMQRIIKEYPPPNTFICINCNAKMFLNKVNRVAMQPDNFWSGKTIEALGITVNSKSYLKRYLRTNGLSQLTSDEIGGHKPTQRNRKERLIEQQNKPEVIKERQDIISKTLDGFGVIDGVS